jgi:hypothetical protein
MAVIFCQNGGVAHGYSLPTDEEQPSLGGGEKAVGVLRGAASRPGRYNIIIMTWSSI